MVSPGKFDYHRTEYRFGIRVRPGVPVKKDASTEVMEEESVEKEINLEDLSCLRECDNLCRKVVMVVDPCCPENVPKQK